MKTCVEVVLELCKLTVLGFVPNKSSCAHVIFRSSPYKSFLVSVLGILERAISFGDDCIHGLGNRPSAIIEVVMSVTADTPLCLHYAPYSIDNSTTQNGLSLKHCPDKHSSSQTSLEETTAQLINFISNILSAKWERTASQLSL